MEIPLDGFALLLFLSPLSGNRRNPNARRCGSRSGRCSHAQRRSSRELLPKFPLRHPRFASDVDAWLNFAAKSRVKEVDLDLEPIEGAYLKGDRYTLPQAIYSHAPLTTLELSCCNLAPPAAAVEWRSMTQLTIHEAELTQKAINEIVLGCPALRRLELYICNGFSRLGIRGRGFRRLDQLVVIFFNEFDHDDVDRLLEISAPYMRELNVDIRPRRCHLKLADVSSLERARIDFFDAISDSSASSVSEEAMLRNSEELLGKIWHVRSLVLDLEMIEVLSRMRERGWRFLESRVIKELDIDFALVNVQNLSVVLSMLESLPFLDKLVIRDSFEKKKTIEDLNLQELIAWDPTLDADLDHDLSHLENVRIEINVYSRVSSELAFILAKILLKRAPILEKMVICNKFPHGRDFVDAVSDEMIKKFETRLIHPRSSRKAILEFIDIEELYVRWGAHN